MNNNFRKAERLRYKSLVDPLFREGKSMFEYPLRMVWRPVSADDLAASFRTGVPADIAPLQMMVTVPKKRRRRAVDRVLIRRRIREAWRLQRHALRDALASNPGLRTLSVGFIFAADTDIPYRKIEAGMARLITKLHNKLSNS
ncbi:MAG: ribonuclease P protein component [Muribaculaceae bacterium]|nr:ribonuclease P protein component [Muribaculaceae bacterium]